MTVIEAVEQDKYKLESMSKNLLLKRAYNEGLADGKQCTHNKLNRVFRLVFHEDNNDGVRIEGGKAQGKPLKYVKKCAVKEETQTMLDEYMHYGYGRV